MNDIQVKKMGRTRRKNNEAFEKINNLKKGEFLYMLTKEWLYKVKPSRTLLRRMLGREFEVRTLEGEVGWKILSESLKN